MEGSSVDSQAAPRHPLNFLESEQSASPAHIVSRLTHRRKSIPQEKEKKETCEEVAVEEAP